MNEIIYYLINDYDYFLYLVIYIQITAVIMLFILILMNKFELILVAGLLSLINCSNPHNHKNNFVFTLVTGLFRTPNFVWETQMNHLRRMAASSFNLIIVAQNDLLDTLPNQIRHSSQTIVLNCTKQSLGQSWIQIDNNLWNKTSQNGEINLLNYNRLFWLNFARQHDSFNTDEFLWVDLDHYPQLEDIITTKNMKFIYKEFKHHFFFLSEVYNSSIHSYPGVQGTYFNTSMSSYVGNKLFGGLRESIETICIMYEDILKVALLYDNRKWSEEALYSLLAYRSPFLISYLTIPNFNQHSQSSKLNKPSSLVQQSQIKNRLLQKIEPQKEVSSFIFEYQSSSINFYMNMEVLVKICILIVGILILYQIYGILQLLKIKKSRLQSYSVVSNTQTMEQQIPID